MAKLALSEIAQRLNLHIETFNRWIKQGKIPVAKSGNIGIFNESELNKWAEQQRSSFRNAGPEGDKEKISPLLPLLTALQSGGLFKNIEGIKKEEVIQSAVNCIPDISKTLRSELYRQIMKREKLTSTGIGKGVAIPHPRAPFKEVFSHPMIVTCFPDQPIDFDSIDGKPVFVFFIILTPSIEAHLSLLSKLSFCLRDNSFITFLEKRPDFETFLARIEAMEQNIEDRGI